ISSGSLARTMMPSASFAHSRRVSGRASGGTIILTCGARIASPSGCIELVRSTIGLSGIGRRSFDDRIMQAAKAFDLDLDGRAGLEPRRRLVQGGHAGRCTRCDDIAGLEYLQRGKVGDEIG